MKCLVTGAGGMLGAHVVLELLKQGNTVMAAHRKNADLGETKAFFTRWDGQQGALYEKAEWLELDIFDVSELTTKTQGLDAIFHCAGMVSFEHRDWRKLMQTNEVGTANIVNACLANNIALCHVSSVAVLHNLDYRKPLDESVFWKKSGRESDYAISKYNAEREVWRGIEEGLEAVIVNPAVILAAGFWNRSSSKIFSTVYNGNPFYTKGVAGYVAATDVAEIMLSLVNKKVFSQRFVLAENCYSYKEIFSWMAQCLGKKPPIFPISKPILMILARFEKIIAWFRGKPARVTPALVNSAFNKQTYSSEKIKNTLNFRFRNTKEMIKEAAFYYLQDQKK